MTRLREDASPGRAPIDFVIAARNAGRDVMNDEARKAAAERAIALELPEDSDDLAARFLSVAIKMTLKALPHLPVGSRQPAGEALKKLALALDISARVFSIAEGARPAHLADLPGTDETHPSPAAAGAASASPARGKARAEIDPEDIPYRPGVDLKPPEQR